MTRRMLCFLILLLLVISAIVQGAAQQTPSRNRGIVVLADSPAVHQELKLVEQQVASVTRAVARSFSIAAFATRAPLYQPASSGPWGQDFLAFCNFLSPSAWH